MLDYGVPGVYAEKGCIHFHQAFYWCTIETLGRPRMIMEQNTTGDPAAQCRGGERIAETNVFQRTDYVRISRTARHLVVVGHQEFVAVNMLLYEFSTLTAVTTG